MHSPRFWVPRGPVDDAPDGLVCSRRFGNLIVQMLKAIAQFLETCDRDIKGIDT